MPERVLIVACGAMARELCMLRRRHGWTHVSVQCLDAGLHNRPAEIGPAVREALARDAACYDHCFVAYADCGTGGRLDDVLREFGAERLPGAHCYQMFAGADRFAALADEEPGTFYLTDFLLRNFARLVESPLGLARRPELRDMYFGNYRRLVYLSQMPDAAMLEAAAGIAARLGLEFRHEHCGLRELERPLIQRLKRPSPVAGNGQDNDQEDARLLA